MSRVALIFGGGANVGVATAKAFAAKGYKVASVSRSTKTHDEPSINLQITGDLAKPESVADAFKQTIDKLGHPSAVIYNAAALTPHPTEDPAAVSLEAFEKDLQINTVSVYAAVQQAVKSFDTLGSGSFIYTGNLLNKRFLSGPFLTLGVGKSASSFLIQNASEAYKAKGYGFYFADERTPEGNNMSGVTGSAHGDFFVELAEGKSQVPWWATFVNGKGYVKFDN